MERHHEQFHGARASDLCTLGTIKSGVTASHEKEKAENWRCTDERSLSSLFLPTKLRTIPALALRTQWVPAGGMPLGFFGGDPGKAEPMLQRLYRSDSLLFQLSRPGVSDPEPGLEMGTFIGS